MEFVCCSKCGRKLEKEGAYACPQCDELFCFECFRGDQPIPDDEKVSWCNSCVKGEIDGQPGTSPGMESMDKIEKEAVSSGTRRQEILSEEKQDSSPETPESSSGDKSSGEEMSTRDTGIRKAGTIVVDCPGCHSMIFEASELFLIEIEDGKLLLRSAGHELSRQVISCHVCKASFTIKQLEKMYLGKSPKIAKEKAKAKQES